MKKKLNLLTLTEKNSKNRVNLILFTLIVGISLFGLMILFSTSSFPAHKSFGDAYYYTKKQSFFVFMGLIIFILGTQVPYQVWKTLAWPLYVLSLLLLCLVFAPLIGREAGGAQRWITFYGFSYQPSDLAKFTTIMVIARIFSQKNQGQLLGRALIIKVLTSLLLIVLPVVLISLEPDFGTSFHLLIVGVFLLFLTNFPFIILLTIGISVAPIIYYNVIQVPWRLKRIIAFLNPWKYRYEEGYQLVAAFKAFLAGEFWGKGLGESMVRHKLQARHTDFIFSVIAEDTGLFGVYLILGIFLFITVYGMILLEKLENNFGKLLGLGILFIFIFQTIIHISVNMGLLPTTGINLPLISYGGTSMVTYLLMFGVLLNILKRTK